MIAEAHEVVYVDVYLMDDEEFRIGRRPDNDLVLPETWIGVSRVHCRISTLDTPRACKFLLMDLGSGNGTYLQPIGDDIDDAEMIIPFRQYELEIGDRVILGHPRWGRVLELRSLENITYRTMGT